jgi:hypothetical protein
MLDSLGESCLVLSICNMFHVLGQSSSLYYQLDQINLWAEASSRAFFSLFQRSPFRACSDREDIDAIPDPRNEALPSIGFYPITLDISQPQPSEGLRSCARTSA